MSQRYDQLWTGIDRNLFGRRANMRTPRERMLRLLSLLQSGRQWTAPDLATATESTPRTLRRDIEFLRNLGYPVQSSRGPGGHYQLVAGRALPPLMLEDDEAIAAVLSLKLAANGATVGEETMTSAARAEAKIHRILPPKLRRTVDALISTTDISSTAGTLPESGTAKTVAEAITAHRILRFDHANTSHTTQREVEPARLVRLQQRWYLFSWDRARSDWRTFRLDRMSNLQIGDEHFHPRTLPANDLPAYLRTRFQGVPERTVVLTLHESAEHAADRLYRIDGTIEPISEQECRYTAHVDSYEWLALSLTLTDIEFTIESPDDFRAYLAHHANRMLRGALPPR